MAASVRQWRAAVMAVAAAMMCAPASSFSPAPMSLPLQRKFHFSSMDGRGIISGSGFPRGRRAERLSAGRGPTMLVDPILPLLGEGIGKGYELFHFVGLRLPTAFFKVVRTEPLLPPSSFLLPPSSSSFLFPPPSSFFPPLLLALVSFLPSPSSSPPLASLSSALTPSPHTRHQLPPLEDPPSRQHPTTQPTMLPPSQ